MARRAEKPRPLAPRIAALVVAPASPRRGPVAQPPRVRVTVRERRDPAAARRLAELLAALLR